MNSTLMFFLDPLYVREKYLTGSFHAFTELIVKELICVRLECSSSIIATCQIQFYINPYLLWVQEKAFFCNSLAFIAMPAT